MVKTGDELVQLDVEIEQAQLRAAEAAAGLARISFNRAKELITSRSISQAELDSADANLKQAGVKRPVTLSLSGNNTCLIAQHVARMKEDLCHILKKHVESYDTRDS